MLCFNVGTFTFELLIAAISVLPSFAFPFVLPSTVLHLQLYVVTLTPENGRVCLGDTAVFTCVTTTGRLAWKFNQYNKYYYDPAQVNESVANVANIFSTSLSYAVLGSTFMSHTSVSNVLPEYKGRNITCADGAELLAESKTVSIQPVGTIQCDSQCRKL